MKTFFFYLMALIIFCPYSSSAQINETKLIPPDSNGNIFGHSVASDGNFLVIGAPFAPYPYNHYGAVYIYEKKGGAWQAKSRLVANDSSVSAQFGYSVSISGDFILIGAFRDIENGPQAGAAYIFKRDSISGDWSQYTKLLPSDGSAYDEFGTYVCLKDDRAIIGAPFNHENSKAVGSAYIFKWNDTTWVEEAKLLAGNTVGKDPQFGISVSIDGDYALVGAWGDEELESQPGAAYIFHFNGINWTQQAKLYASSSHLNHDFGGAVSLSGDYAAIGSRRTDTTSGGAAFIYHRADTTWLEEDIVVGHPGFTHAFFGQSVSIDGDYLVVGASDDDNNGNHAGCIYIFKRDGVNWIEQAMVLASDGSENDWMGWSVYIEGDQVFAGAPNNDCGAVYIYSGFVTEVNENDVFQAGDFYLEQNYPNPFNPTTIIKYSIPSTSIPLLGGERGGLVTLKVYDVLGREVALLVNERKQPGEYEVEFDAKNLPSGVYFYRMQAGDFVSTKKLILLK